ncbi:exonuclease 3'-5' domain-containing protein 2-like isoform X1 [Sitodiplosis mosellana]|uniref:exonuclease 3'-5' domain-containing protein 2-like isoform X1 n=1 Tax=Sitodiplosis mosellana TaxID=263140 RepID=UPI002443A621|nr:exonuclease 3'-5' domain-containing protein 2-like isoform X1 [Sitodiplosis mosellana]
MSGGGNRRDTNLTATAAVATIAAGVAAGYALYRGVEWLLGSNESQENQPHQNHPHQQNQPNPYREQLRLPMIRRPQPITPHRFLRNQVIHVVNTVEQCQYSMKELKTHCDEYNVLGFDCEWNLEQESGRKSVALLQLASSRGLCVLIRLSELQYIPKELEAILEDASIIKVGVAPDGDAALLKNDYDGVRVASTLDLRFVAQEAKSSVMRKSSLAHMADEFLGVSLDKDPSIRCSNWEASTLTNAQIDYAATDAHVAIELFKYFAKKIDPTKKSEYIIENYFVNLIDEDFDYQNFEV